MNISSTLSPATCNSVLILVSSSVIFVAFIYISNRLIQVFHLEELIDPPWMSQSNGCGGVSAAVIIPSDMVGGDDADDCPVSVGGDDADDCSVLTIFIETNCFSSSPDVGLSYGRFRN